MRRRPLDQMSCSIAKALDVVGDPWTMLIMRDALLGVTRFDDFARRLGIPRATLSARLEALCGRGVLERSPTEGYRATVKGEALRTVVLALMQWGDQWERDDDPPTRLVEKGTGRTIHPVLVDADTGVPIDSLRVRAEGPVTAGIRRRSDNDVAL